MRQYRKNVFETNSSSTHSITICTKEEYDGWVNGKLLYDEYFEIFEKYELTDDDYINGENYYNNIKQSYYKDWKDLTKEEHKDFILRSGIAKNKIKNGISRNDWLSRHNDSTETYHEEFTTPSGDRMVAFGYYGYDG